MVFNISELLTFICSHRSAKQYSVAFLKEQLVIPVTSLKSSKSQPLLPCRPSPPPRKPGSSERVTSRKERGSRCFCTMLLCASQIIKYLLSAYHVPGVWHLQQLSAVNCLIRCAVVITEVAKPFSLRVLETMQLCSH